MFMRSMLIFLIEKLLPLQSLFEICSVFLSPDDPPNLHGIDTFRERELLQHITRDPNRKIVYNYPISNNYTLRKISIDVSKELYSDKEELDRHMPVVTGMRQSEAYLGLGMVASVQSHMPLKRIIVYTMGVHPKIIKQVQCRYSPIS